MLQIEVEGKNRMGFGDLAREMKDKNPGNPEARRILGRRLDQLLGVTEPGKIIQGKFGKSNVV